MRKDLHWENKEETGTTVPLPAHPRNGCMDVSKITQVLTIVLKQWTVVLQQYWQIPYLNMIYATNLGA